MRTEPTTESNSATRRRGIGAFASASASELAECFSRLGNIPSATSVRGPEMGLVMLRGRAGGGGAPFNLGEVSVTRATVRLETGEVGHAMILGRDAKKARMAAHLDALWQHADWRERIEADVIEPTLEAQAAADRVRAEETAATQVDFFTLARGDD